MNNSEEKFETVRKNDLTFVEILGVLLRYRKFICIFTFSVFFLTFLFFFILPKTGKIKSENSVLVIYSGNIETIASDLKTYLNLDFVSRAEKELTNYMNFAKIHKSYDIFSDKGFSERQYNTAIKNFMDSNKFLVSFEKSNNTFQIVAEVRESKVSDYKKFISEYAYYCSSLIENDLNNVIEAAKKNIDDLIDNKTNDKNSSDLAKLTSVRLAIKSFEDSHQQIIYLAGDPFEAKLSLGRLKKLITISIIAFFFSVLLAFLFYNISKIKANPETRKFILDAWKAGK